MNHSRDFNKNIYLDESGEIIRNEKEIANVFNKYFANIVPNIMGNNHNLLSDLDTTNDPIQQYSQLIYQPS